MSRGLSCIQCGSDQVFARNHARRACGILGAAAGALSGYKTADRETAPCETSSPATHMLALISSLLTALFSSASGCAAGAAIGRTIDDNVLKNFQCMNCGHSFAKV